MTQCEKVNLFDFKCVGAVVAHINMTVVGKQLVPIAIKSIHLEFY